MPSNSDRIGADEVRYTIAATPHGEMLLAATSRGVVCVRLPGDDFDSTLRLLARSVSADLHRDEAALGFATDQLDQYFAGERQAFDLPLDTQLIDSGFRERALAEVNRIGFAQTASYSKVAANMGAPGASRAVGTACATNPIALVIPCHRVVKADGSVGNYGGGVRLKESLLAHEQRPLGDRELPTQNRPIH